MSKKEEIKNRISLINRGEVPKGYKCLHGNVCPYEWELKTLGCLCSKVLKKNKENRTLPVLTNSATQGIILQEEYFDREIVNDTNTNGYYVVKYGDFMYNPRISANAPVGPINRCNLKTTGIVSPLYNVFRAKKGANVHFLERYFLSSLWHRYIKSISNQGARHDRLNLLDKDFYKMLIPLPTLNEQEKIVKILNCCDKVIELKQKLLDEKRKREKYYLHKLLELNDFSCPKYKMGDITHIQTGNSNTQDKDDNGIYPFYVRSQNIERSNNYTFDGEAILIPGDGEIGTVYHYAQGKFDYHQRVYKISDFKNTKGKFVYYYLKAFFKHHALRYTAKATVDSLRLPMLLGFVIKTPPIYVQDKIINCLDNLNLDIVLFEQELEAYKRLKKSLSQLLLTGIVRVKA